MLMRAHFTEQFNLNARNLAHASLETAVQEIEFPTNLKDFDRESREGLFAEQI